MKRKHIIIYLGPFFLSSCSYFVQGELEILVTSNKEPIQDAQLILYGKNKNKEIFIGYFYPNAQGKVATSIDFSKYQSFKIVTTSKSIEKILLPAIETVSVPHWWQEHVLKLNIDLPALPVPAKNVETQFKQAPNIQEDKDSAPTKEVVVISQIESNIYEAPTPKNQFKINIYPHSIPNNISPTMMIQTNNSNTNRTITENKVNYSKTATFKITSNNNPVDKVQIFTGYNVSQIVKREGETSATGEIKFNFNSSTAPDILIIKKNGYITSVSPFIENAGNQPVLFDLKAGKSHDFLIQNYAYDIGRGFDKTTLLLNGAKQDVSTGLGFLTLGKELKVDDILSIEQQNSIIANISADDLKKLPQNKEDEFQTLFLPPIKPFKPTVAFLEPNLTGPLESNMLWRRARREFFSRFINEQSFKTKIQDDLIKITNLNANSVPGSLIDIFKRGWENSSFAKDIDILIQIDFIESEESPTMVGRIYAKNGQILAEQKKSFNDTNAEQAASQLYNFITEQLPIDSYVIQQEKAVFTLNVGKKQHINKGDLFVAFIPQNFYSIPNKPVGVLKVTEVSDTEAKATAIIGLEKLQSNVSIRGVRASQAFIDHSSLGNKLQSKYMDFYQ